MRGGGTCLNAPCRLFGFTLAEVLITLGIIGVVAALTMPMIIPRLEKMKTEAKLKKFYHTISRATIASISKNGEMKDWDYSSAKNLYNKYYKDELNVLGTYYSGVSMYIILQDGTCASLQQKYSIWDSGYFSSEYYWLINTNCGAFPQQGGLTIFDLALYNFIDASKDCSDIIPTGCAWPGDKIYDPTKNYVKKASCYTINYQNHDSYNPYTCYLKFVQDGMRFKDDYNYYKNKRIGNAMSDSSNYWKKIK